MEQSRPNDERENRSIILLASDLPRINQEQSRRCHQVQQVQLFFILVDEGPVLLLPVARFSSFPSLSLQRRCLERSRR
jgi:hypothetical protein